MDLLGLAQGQPQAVPYKIIRHLRQLKLASHVSIRVTKTREPVPARHLGTDVSEEVLPMATFRLLPHANRHEA